MTKPGPKPKEGALQLSPYPLVNLNQAVYGECMTAVYVMTTGDAGSTKVGISDHPENRCAALNKGFDREIRIYWAVRLTRQNALAVEQAIHKSYRGTMNHKKGEWYSLSAETARKAILSEIKKQGFASEPDICFGLDRSFDEGSN